MMIPKFAWCGLVALLIVGIAAADDLPRARPEELGFSAQRLTYLDEFFGKQVKDGDLAGIVILVSRHGKIAHFSALGYADVEKKKPMQTDTIFRIYSMTKPIASVALMMLYEEGRFQMQDPLAKYIPEFANLRVLRNPDGALDDTVPPVRPPTVEDALRHTTGFTHGGPNNPYDAQYLAADYYGLDVSLAEMMTKLSKIPLRYQPGTKWNYSISPDIVARLVETLSGMPFDQFLEQRLFKPLQMKDTQFWLPADRSGRLATLHWVKDGKFVPLDDAHGHPEGDALVQPWSVNSYAVDHKRKGGSYGLLSTAEDYWRFAQMMLNGGDLNGKRVLSPHVVQYMASNRLHGVAEPPCCFSFGLGFAVAESPAAFGWIASPGSYYWGGAAATSFWIDPKEDLIIIAMTQHMGPVRGTPYLQERIGTLVYSALVK